MPLNLPRRAPKKNLVCTVYFDAPGSESCRFLGKMLPSSLLKTYFTGDIVIFRNSPAPPYLVERKELEEVYLETPDIYGQEKAEDACCWKYRVAPLIENPEQYDKILFLDCDSLALRNIDHLLEGDWDIRCQPERGKPGNGKSFNTFLTEEEMGIAAKRDRANSGTLAVRGSIFHEVMGAWQEIDESEPVRDSGFRDQAGWNAVLLRKGIVGPGGALPSADSRSRLPHQVWKTEPFPEGEVQFPGCLDPHHTSCTKAAVTHNILPDTKEKIEFTFGLSMRTFCCDPTGSCFPMLEI